MVSSKNPSIKIDLIETVEILERICKDGYLSQKDMQKDFYTSTFNGRLFCENGGYKEEKSRLDAKKLFDLMTVKNAEKNAKRLNRLTFGLMIGTFALATIEVIKLFLC